MDTNRFWPIVNAYRLRRISKAEQFRLEYNAWQLRPIYEAKRFLVMSSMRLEFGRNATPTVFGRYLTHINLGRYSTHIDFGQNLTHNNITIIKVRSVSIPDRTQYGNFGRYSTRISFGRNLTRSECVRNSTGIAFGPYSTHIDFSLNLTLWLKFKAY